MSGLYLLAEHRITYYVDGHNPSHRIFVMYIVSYLIIIFFFYTEYIHNHIVFFCEWLTYFHFLDHGQKQCTMISLSGVLWRSNFFIGRQSVV